MLTFQLFAGSFNICLKKHLDFTHRRRKHYAYGAPYEGSDIDLMVIIEDKSDALKTNLKIQKGLCDRSVPLDILVNNVSKFEEFAESPSLQNQIKNKGALLYDKRHVPDLA